MAEYIVIEVADENGVFADVRKPLIRCRDCKFWRTMPFDPLETGEQVCTWNVGLRYGWASQEKDYCSRAERREDG